MVVVNLAWLYAITKYGYPPSLDQIFKAFEDAARLGFKYIEVEAYKEHNLDEIEENKKAILEKGESLGLKIVNFAGIFPEILSPDDSVRAKGLKMMERSAKLANYFGSSLLQTDTFTPPVKFVGTAPYSGAVVFGVKYQVEIDPSFSWRKFWNMLVNVYREIARIADDHGLKFVLEPRIGETISNSDAMLRLLDEVNMDNFGAVLDTGHLHAAKELIPLSIEKLGEKIMYVHVSDNDGRDNWHLAPGEGTIDWDGVFKGLKKFGFNGPIAIDVGGKDILDQLDEKVLKAKEFVEKAVEKYGL